MIDNLKMESNEVKVTNGNETRHLKISIDEAYDSFIAVQHMNVEFTKRSRLQQ
jgi:hypothetical protein